MTAGRVAPVSVAPVPTPRYAAVPPFRSVRLRIAVTVAVVSLLVPGVVGAVLAQRAATAAREALRTEALGRLDVVTDGYALDGRLRYGASLDPATAPPELAAPLADPTLRRPVTYFDGTAMYAAARLGRSVVLVTSLPGDGLRTQAAARVQALLWAALAAVVGSGVLGWAAGTTLSRRLRRAAAAAGAIATGAADAADVRAAQSGRDEVAVLTAAVDDMATALRRRLEEEKAFTSDVAHELRTPLTGLVSAAELLPDAPESALVRAQVVRLRRLVEDLLEVSRLDRAAEAVAVEPLDLAQAVRESLDRLGVAPVAPDSPDRADPAHPADPGTGGGGLEVSTRHTETVLVEPRRLDRVLGNLLTNLDRHGGGAGRLVVEGRRVVLTDVGAGYPDEVLAQGPRPFHGEGAGKGSGLGLTIAVKQAQVMGATVGFGTADGGGARTTVTFAPAVTA